MYLFWLVAVTIFCSFSPSRQKYAALQAPETVGARLLSLQGGEAIADRGEKMEPLLQSLGRNEALRLPSDNLTNAWTPPLSTRGRFIVDAKGTRFKLKAGNWHGASGTYLGRGDIGDPSNHHAGEQAFQTPLCLDRTPIADIVQSFLDLGINTIRLPFSNEMIHSTSSPPNNALRANPQLQGLTPLEIYDVCIAELTRRGLAVILNNHTVKSLWCCGVDVNARWNGAQTAQAWEDDWILMVKRYKANPRVVGAELYNEVRRDFLLDPVWGDGGSTDWWLASQLAGTRILREANADILIIIEGINYVGIPSRYTTHYRPELQPLHSLSHTMPILDKLVYASHFYSYTGPNATGGVDLGGDDALYRDLSPSALETTINQLAFYVATPPQEEQKHYTNPVWISEFGSAGRPDFLSTDRYWWANFTSLLAKYDIDYALWPLTGWQENAKGDLWALNAWDSNGNRLSILDPGDWRLDSYQNLVDSAGQTGLTAQTPRWHMLYTSLGSMQASNLLQSNASLSKSGTVQASCPDGLRLAGLSYEERPKGLCTDVTFGRELWNISNGNYEVVSTEAHVAIEWARGYTKLQCPTHHHLIGFTQVDDSMQSAVCASSSRDLVAGGSVGNRTIWINKESKLANDRGAWQGQEAGITAGSCNDDELLIGFAFSSHDKGYPAALFCQNYNSSATVNISNSAIPSKQHPLPLFLPLKPVLSLLLAAALIVLA